MTEDVVVRVNRQPNQRLQREAVLCGALPDFPWAPTVIAYAGDPGTDFLIIERRPGAPLSRSWPMMSTELRKESIRQLGEILTTLHATPTPVAVPRIENSPHLLDPRCVSPVVPLLMALEKIRGFPRIDSMLIREVEQLVMDHGDSIQDYPQTTLIHGDLTFENILWDGSKISALVDFEWCRGAPGDLDLDVFLRFCALPHAHVAPDYEAHTKAADYELVPTWISEFMPQLFEHDRLAERLTMYMLAFDVQELEAFGVASEPRNLGPLHPYKRLQALIDGQSYLEPVLNQLQPL